MILRIVEKEELVFLLFEISGIKIEGVVFGQVEKILMVLETRLAGVLIGKGEGEKI